MNSGSRGARDVLDELEWSDRAREQVRRVAVEAIEAEMAIHRDRLAKLVAGAFDLTRVNASRATSILAQVPGAHYKGDESEVLWSTAVEPGTWQAARGDAAGTRSVDHIPLREISNVMAAVCADSSGAGRSELLREALGRFGIRRLTQGIERRMAGALAYALDHDVLSESEGVYRRSAR